MPEVKAVQLAFMPLLSQWVEGCRSYYTADVFDHNQTDEMYSMIKLVLMLNNYRV